MDHQNYRYLTLLSMIYMTIKLTTVILIYKVIKLGPYHASASTLIMPFWFFIGDIITETYGYQVSRHVIWTAMMCQFIFAILCYIFIHINLSPANLNTDPYLMVLGRLPRVVVSSFLAVMFGAFINAYTLSKSKIILRGRYFWLRSIGATAIGELVFTMIAYLSEFIGVTSFSQVIQLMSISFLVKMFLNPILAIPAWLISYQLKKLERMDAYDYNVNYNPFKLRIDDTHGARIKL